MQFSISKMTNVGILSTLLLVVSGSLPAATQSSPSVPGDQSSQAGQSGNPASSDKQSGKSATSGSSDKNGDAANTNKSNAADQTTSDQEPNKASSRAAGADQTTAPDNTNGHSVSGLWGLLGLLGLLGLAGRRRAVMEERRNPDRADTRRVA